MSKEFQRRDIKRYSKLGKNRKAIQSWRKPRGRDNKMRLKLNSYPGLPTVGHKTQKTEAGKIKGMYPILVSNVADLKTLGKEHAAIISGRVGARKKMEIIKSATELKIKILNLQAEAKK
tara:strand:- start:4842 stop:5198 length:357 start_codon:yes stop_codon:yes gene_type:complete